MTSDRSIRPIVATFGRDRIISRLSLVSSFLGGYVEITPHGPNLVHRRSPARNGATSQPRPCFRRAREGLSWHCFYAPHLRHALLVRLGDRFFRGAADRSGSLAIRLAPVRT